jgi:Fe-S-cluster-containing hydrogenase component 2
LPWHKHAVFVNSEKCSGCLTCLKKCPHGAYSKK